MSDWHQLHYNAIAKEIRELFPIHIDKPNSRAGQELMAYRSILTVLALSLTRRFARDNPSFDPVKFLDQCSPNVDFFPLGELWNGRR